MDALFVIVSGLLGFVIGERFTTWFLNKKHRRELRRQFEDPRTTDDEAIAILKKYGG